MKIRTLVIAFSLAQLFIVERTSFATEKKEAKFSIKDPFKIRDPFKRPQMKKGRSQRKVGGQFLRNNSYSNVPTLEGINLESIRIVGVLLGKKRRAVAKIVNGSVMGKETYFVTEGMKLGENNAEVKAILPGGVVLVEKIRNVYDQDEYIETIIPISSGI